MSGKEGCAADRPHQGAMSDGSAAPDVFEGEEFGSFCAACYRVREFKPTLTVSGLYGVLLVAAAHPRSMSYEDFARGTGQAYNAAAIQAGHLSDGRGEIGGLGLLRRLPGADRKQKLLALSDTGRVLARIFHDGKAPSDLELAEHLENSVKPALATVRGEAPRIALGTFCVLLAVTLNADRFKAYSDPSGTVGDKLGLPGISNLSKHLENLGSGSETRAGLGLIRLKRHAENRRVVLPELTEKGVGLVTSLASVFSDGRYARGAGEVHSAPAAPC